MTELSIEFGPGYEDVSVNGSSNAIGSGEDIARHVSYVNGARANNFLATSGVMAAGRSDNPRRIRLAVEKGGRFKIVECIDLHGAFGVTGLGNGEPFLSSFIASAALHATPTVAATLAHPWTRPALEAIRAIAEMPDGQVFFASDGHVVIDAACRIALNYEAKRLGLKIDGTDPAWKDICIVVASNCYHGSGGFARAFLTNPKARENFGPLPTNVITVPYGDAEKLAELFESPSRPHIAGVMIERVQGAGGCVAPPEDYIARVSEICRTNGSLFIVDDVKGGLGRLGDLLACPSSGVHADIVCGGKAAGGGIVPFSFVIGRKDVMSGFTPGTYGLTVVATPIQCVALLGTLKLLSDKKDGVRLVDDVARKARMFEMLFDELRERYPEHVRAFDGRGLMRSLETTLPGKDLVERLRERGVHTGVVERNPNRVYVAPALTITDSEIGEAVASFAGALSDLVPQSCGT